MSGAANIEVRYLSEETRGTKKFECINSFSCTYKTEVGKITTEGIGSTAERKGRVKGCYESFNLKINRLNVT